VDGVVTNPQQSFHPLKLQSKAPSTFAFNLRYNKIPFKTYRFILIFRRLAEKDPRAEPLRSQRVPYIVVYGDPNVPLIQLIRRPEDFIGNSNLRLNAHYYVEKAIIPPLNRCFSLAKMDVSKWYADMPRKYLKSHYVEGGRGGGAKKGTIDQYFVSESCIKCESRTATGFCETCFSNAGEVRDYLNQEEIRISQKFETCMNVRINPYLCMLEFLQINLKLHILLY